jgi:hypothetical protein
VIDFGRVLWRYALNKLLNFMMFCCPHLTKV